MIHFEDGKFFAPAIKTVFPLLFEQSKNGLPEVIHFYAFNFRRPLVNNANAVNDVVGALQLTGAITDRYNEDVDQDGITKVKNS